MSKVTVELTLEQLIEAFVGLTPEEQLQVLQAIAAQDGDKRPSPEAIEFAQEIRNERERNLRAVTQSLSDDLEDSELTVFMSLNSKDFHA